MDISLNKPKVIYISREYKYYPQCKKLLDNINNVSETTYQILPIYTLDSTTYLYSNITPAYSCLFRSEKDCKSLQSTLNFTTIIASVSIGAPFEDRIYYYLETL